LPQILEAVQDEFNVSSVYVGPWDCNKSLDLFSREGIIKLEIPSQIAGYMLKIAYSIATSVEGTPCDVFWCRSLLNLQNNKIISFS